MKISDSNDTPLAGAAAAFAALGSEQRLNVLRTLVRAGPDGLSIGALVGGPAYLNGYAAVPLLAGLSARGMSQGAAMAFVIAGGVSSIPEVLAVRALVRPHSFAAYLGFDFCGALAAGSLWGAFA